MDFDSNIFIVKYSLSFVGLWPENSSHINVKYTISLVLNIIGTILNIIRLAVTKNDTDPLENVWLLFAFTTSVIMMYVTKYNSRKIIIIINWMKKNWEKYDYLPQEVQTLIHRQGVKGKKYIWLFHIIVGAVALSAAFSPIVTSIVNNVPLAKYSDKGWYSFSIKKSPGIEIMYIIRGLTIINCGIALNGIQCFFIFIFHHIFAQIYILCYIINTYKDESAIHNDITTDEINYCNCLGCIINHHNSITKISALVEDYSTIIFFMKFLGSGIQICIFGTILVGSGIDKISQIPQKIFYFIAYSWNSFFNGWLGDQLIQHGYKIGDAIYANNWYELRELKIRQTFSIIICRARRPMKVTAGKYFPVSLRTVGQLYLSWMSYVSVLNALKSS